MKKALLILLIISLISLSACTTSDPNVNPEPKENENNETLIEPQVKVPVDLESATPSVAGIRLGDHKDKVIEILGQEYLEMEHDEPGHFPEAFVNWEYEDGFIISIGQKSNQVLQIMATSSKGETNLGVKIGDSAKDILNTYRAKYLEPESIHGGKLLGVFKVENGQALIFDFNVEDGLVNPTEEIKPEEILERIILTYPTYLDDSF